jgi:transcription initiation factor TFIIIB Brf1 subunit/transcription initiation factor TFIIB
MDTYCDNSCKHTETEVDGGITFCTECGLELQYFLVQDDHASFNIDPSRCSIRRHTDKVIYSDIQSIGLSNEAMKLSNDIYMDACKSIHRGRFRKAIIFACVFNACNILQEPRDYTKLVNLFEITRTDALKGIKHIRQNVSKDSLIYRQNITAVHFIREYLNYIGFTKDDIDRALVTYTSIDGKSSLLNRSKPQSVASGFVSFYSGHIVKTNNGSVNGSSSGSVNVSAADISKFSHISESTIYKTEKEVRRVIQVCNIAI